MLIRVVLFVLCCYASADFGWMSVFPIVPVSWQCYFYKFSYWPLCKLTNNRKECYAVMCVFHVLWSFSAVVPAAEKRKSSLTTPLTNPWPLLDHPLHNLHVVVRTAQSIFVISVIHPTPVSPLGSFIYPSIYLFIYFTALLQLSNVWLCLACALFFSSVPIFV